MPRKPANRWTVSVKALGLASLSFASACGESDPDASPAGGMTTSPATLPAPPRDACQVQLDCDDAIVDDPKVDCAVTITVAGVRAYAGLSGVEKRGRSSLNFPKPNYAFELREADGTNRAAEFFGFGQDEDWILDGSWADRSFVRNSLVSDLFQAFSTEWYAPQAGYCTLEINGEAQGLYRLVERIKRGGARVPLVKDDGTGQSFVIHQDDDGSLRLELGIEGRWDPVYPSEPTTQQREGIQTWLDELGRALDRRSAESDGVFGQLDRSNVVDWVLLQEFAKNIDAYKLSIYLTKDVGGLGQLVPWDFDLAFGQPEVASGSNELERAHLPEGWVPERTDMLRDLIAVPGFAEALAMRWTQLRRGPLATATVLNQVAAHVAIIEPLTDANFAIWPLDEVRFEPIYGPYHLYEVRSYAAEVDHLTRWIEARLQWIDENIGAYAEDN